MSRVAAVTGALCLFLATTTAWAAEPQDVANDIADEVMSPFCPGVTLLECASSQAYELRGRIVQWVEKGRSREWIMDRLERQFGSGIRAAPQGRGSGLIAWIVPGLAAGAGLGVMALLLRRWGRAASRHEEATESPISSEDHRRLSAELEAVRRQKW